MKQVTQKVKKKFKQRHAELMLAIISFTESSFLPVIVDPFLVAMILAKTQAWFRFASITVITSILGGICGYIIGALFFDLFGSRIIDFYNLQAAFDRTVASVGDNTFLFTLIGAMTPLPYKIVVLVGGFLKINFFYFLLASIIGRSVRFYVVGYITKQFGEYALATYVKELHMVTAAVAIGVLLYVVVIFVL